MKSFLLAVSFVTGALAATQAVPDNVQWLSLQARSEVQALNGLFVSARSGKVGLFEGDRTDLAKAAKIFTTAYTPTQTYSMHIADDSHQIALQGSNGLLDLVDLVNPSTDNIPTGGTTEWSTFLIGSDGAVSIKDGNVVPTRRWVAYENTDGSYAVALYDGITVPQTHTFTNITLNAVRAS